MYPKGVPPSHEIAAAGINRMEDFLKARLLAGDRLASDNPERLKFGKSDPPGADDRYTVLRYPMKLRNVNLKTYLHGTIPERVLAIMLEGKMRASTTNIKQGFRGVYAVTEDHSSVALGYAVGTPLGRTELMYQFVFELQADATKVKRNAMSSSAMTTSYNQMMWRSPPSEYTCDLQEIILTVTVGGDQVMKYVLN